jgi:hypothetical protein
MAGSRDTTPDPEPRVMPKVGDAIAGRFRLVERGGQGGMGVVFRAIDVSAGTTVAVKLLEARSEEERERARREVEILARMSHPGIVRHVADGLLSANQFYVVMEWLEGQTVDNRLSRDGFTVREALAMVRCLADALASAHRLDVIHRDVKPANIVLVGNDPAAPKLIDFGVARLGDPAQSLTRPGVAVGTVGYMAPEQARGERELTPAADVFGLGCVLYECLTATPAFSGTAAAAVMAKIVLAEPPPLKAGCPEATRSLIALVDRMLAKHLGHRLPDAGAVVSQIDALGRIPRSPRRALRQLAVQPTRATRPTEVRHCIVVAGRGTADELLEPPSAGQRERLVAAAEQRHAILETLASGAVVAHLTGVPAEVSHRAAWLALAMRPILPSWTIAISSVRHAIATAADQGAALLTHTALGAAFRGKDAGGIAVDPETAELLKGDFELDAANRLVGATTGMVIP